MEKTKVVVMGAQDVAAMRNAHKDAERAYFEAKVGALEFVAEEMRSTGAEYTASDLAMMSGLTPGEVAAQLGYYGCRASRQAGIDPRKVERRDRYQELQFVRVMPNGQVNPDQCITIRRRQTTYQIDANKKK